MRIWPFREHVVCNGVVRALRRDCEGVVRSSPCRGMRTHLGLPAAHTSRSPLVDQMHCLSSHLAYVTYLRQRRSCTTLMSFACVVRTKWPECGCAWLVSVCASSHVCGAVGLLFVWVCWGAFAFTRKQVELKKRATCVCCIGLGLARSGSVLVLPRTVARGCHNPQTQVCVCAYLSISLWVRMCSVCVFISVCFVLLPRG